MKHSLKSLFIALCSSLACSAPALSDAIPSEHLRIVGGADFDIQSAPATVALLNSAKLAQTGSFFDSQFCGGTLIASRWVLTAAHCLQSASGTPTPAAEISVLAGSTDLSNPVNQPVPVSQILQHADFNAITIANDIALLHLSHDALTSAAPLDALPTILNDDGLIVGWGALNEKDFHQEQQFPHILQGAYVQLIPGVQCSELFPVYAGDVSDEQLCAAASQGGIDSCQGDSGGPLYRRDQQSPGGLSLAGVVSWGYGCADPSSPGVYTRVAAYLDWIRSTIASEQSGLEFPVDDDVVKSSLQSSHGGSTGSLTLLLLILAAGCRTRSARSRKGHQGRSFQGCRITLPLCLLICSTGILPLYASSVVREGVSLSLMPIGDAREPVMISATALWQLTADCQTVRTAFGRNRRSWFLESCTFAEPQLQTLCGARPVTVVYHFLEQHLVQVSYKLEPIKDDRHFKHCIQQQAETLSGPSQPGILVESDGRITVSDIDKVADIHALH